MSEELRKPFVNSVKMMPKRKMQKMTKGGRTRKQDISRAFDPAVLTKATKLVRQYRLTFERDAEVGFVGSSIEMPYVMADGATIEDCATSTAEALIGAIATLLEAGERPPSPASKGKRERQINVRLTAEEKVRLEEAARREGFRSISDFIRTTALNRAS